MVSRIQLIADRRVILLFYQPFERDNLFRYDRYIKRVVRPLYNLTHRRQKQSGFDVSFDLLKRALAKADAPSLDTHEITITAVQPRQAPDVEAAVRKKRAP